VGLSAATVFTVSKCAHPYFTYEKIIQSQKNETGSFWNLRRQSSVIMADSFQPRSGLPPFHQIIGIKTKRALEDLEKHSKFAADVEFTESNIIIVK